MRVEFGESKLQPIGRPSGMPRARVGNLYHAIRDKCVDCMGYEAVVVRIGECAIEECALWRFRPYQGRTKDVSN